MESLQNEHLEKNFASKRKRNFGYLSTMDYEEKSWIKWSFSQVGGETDIGSCDKMDFT